MGVIWRGRFFLLLVGETERLIIVKRDGEEIGGVILHISTFKNNSDIKYEGLLLSVVVRFRHYHSTKE